MYYSQFMSQIQKGKKSEIIFEKTAQVYDFKAVKSNITNDKLHIDYKLYNPQGKYQTVDVKSISSRSKELFVVELVNNWNYQGWLYSQTNLIALFTITTFNFYSLPKLQEFIKTKTININNWHCSRTEWIPYAVYSRREMSYVDRWIVLPLVDIEHLLIKQWKII